MGNVTPGPFWLAHLACVLQVPEGVLNARRGDLLAVAGAITLVPAVASDLIGAGFATALWDRPTPDYWEARADEYGHLYMSLGTADVQRQLACDLIAVQSQLANPNVWATASRLVTLYGKTFADVPSKAADWYRTAVASADESGDLPARVWARAHSALTLAYWGTSLDEADAMADQALELSDRSTLGRLNACLAKAHIAALRDDKTAALNWLGQGTNIFDVVSSDDPLSDYAMPEWRMATISSLVLSRIGDERRAAEVQDVASRVLPESLPRFATHLELHRGLLLAKTGDKQGGVAYARAALDKLPAGRHSATLRAMMGEIKHATV
ncbi:XRE family transcriptional regulator [Catenulispora yoronensis]